MAQHALVPIERLPSCEACQRLPAAGAYIVTFTTGKQVMMLCAKCALADAAKRWGGGFMHRKLTAIELVAVIVPVPPIYVKGELAQEEALLAYIKEAEA